MGNNGKSVTTVCSKIHRAAGMLITFNFQQGNIKKAQSEGKIQ